MYMVWNHKVLVHCENGTLLQPSINNYTCQQLSYSNRKAQIPIPNVMTKSKAYQQFLGCHGLPIIWSGGESFRVSWIKTVSQPTLEFSSVEFEWMKRRQGDKCDGTCMTSLSCYKCQIQG